MEITAREWGDLRQAVGRIEAKLEPLEKIPDRVAALEQHANDDEDAWQRRDKVYLRAFAAVGSVGAIVSVSTVLLTALHV